MQLSIRQMPAFLWVDQRRSQRNERMEQSRHRAPYALFTASAYLLTLLVCLYVFHSIPYNGPHFIIWHASEIRLSAAIQLG